MSQLVSQPIRDWERPYLLALGTALRRARDGRGLSRQAVAIATGLNPRSIARIERAERRTRARTLNVLCQVLADDPRSLLDELIGVAGPALADESPHAERIEARRLKRRRRIEVLHEREYYAAQRAALEARWAARAASRARLRAAFRLLDYGIIGLKRLGRL